jgi:hypothetical protein
MTQQRSLTEADQSRGHAFATLNPPFYGTNTYGDVDQRSDRPKPDMVQALQPPSIMDLDDQVTMDSIGLGIDLPGSGLSGMDLQHDWGDGTTMAYMFDGFFFGNTV